MTDSAERQTTEVSRRGFVGWAFGLGSGFIALAVGIPLVGSVVGRFSQAPPSQFVEVADVASLPVGEPFALTFVEEAQDAYNISLLPHAVFAVKRSETDVTVFSPVCTHLGCQVFFDRASNTFECPCHGSVFALDGTVKAGPAPRPLDTLPTKIDKGQLSVQWVQYKPGVAEKTAV